MYQAYKFRMCPNQEQETLIHKTFGCYRFIYNYFLNECREKGYQKAYEICKKLKKIEHKYSWLKEVDNCNLRCAIFNLEDAYKNYFSKRGNQPIFKSKFQRQAYRTNCIRSSYKEKNIEFLDIENFMA